MSQPTTPSIPYLDGWRGLAIVLVLVSHFAPLAQTKLLGPLGVAMFFVLSGYLMSGILFIRETRLDDFFIRRIARILPAFIVFVLAIAFWAHLQGGTGARPDGVEILATLSFLRTYFPSDIGIWAPNRWPIGHLWSLNVEEHSYIFLALLSVIAARLRWKYAAALLLAGISIAMLFHNIQWYRAPPASASPWFLRTEAAALGLIAAAALRTCRHRLAWTGIDRYRARGYVPAALPLLAFGSALMFVTAERFQGYVHTLAPVLLAVSVNYLDKIPGMLRRLMSANWLGWFGRCSFSLYLWQQPFYASVRDHQSNSLAALALALLAGTLSFYLLEDPARRWLNRRWHGRAGKLAETPALS